MSTWNLLTDLPRAMLETFYTDLWYLWSAVYIPVLVLCSCRDCSDGVCGGGGVSCVVNIVCLSVICPSNGDRCGEREQAGYGAVKSTVVFPVGR
jgi:hypothetical protein